MGNVGYRFLTSFFNLFLIWVILVNFIGWSGGSLNLTGVADYTDWTNSYFGFSSIFGMLKAWDRLVNQVPFFSMQNFPEHLNWLINVITLGFPDLLDTLVNGNFGDGMSILKAFLLLLTEPIAMLLSAGIIVGHLVNIIFAFIQVFLMAITGAFNIPFANMPETPQTATSSISAIRDIGYLLV